MPTNAPLSPFFPVKDLISYLLPKFICKFWMWFYDGGENTALWCVVQYRFTASDKGIRAAPEKEKKRKVIISAGPRSSPSIHP